MRQYLVILFFLFIGAPEGIGTAYAQTEIRGVLRTEEKVLDSARISVIGSNVHCYSDIDGAFQFFLNEFSDDSLKIRIDHLDIVPYTKSFFIQENQLNDLGVIRLRYRVAVSDIFIHYHEEEGVEKGLKEQRKMHGVGEVNYVGDDNDATLNIAEDVKKMTGLHVGHDHGDGNEVAVRGTPNDWNLVLINGVRMPIASESGNRSFGLSAIPTAFVEYASVSRSGQVELAGDAIGGILNVRLKSVADSNYLRLKISKGLNFQSMRPLLNGGLLWNKKSRNNAWGFLLGANSNYRNLNSDELEIVYFGEENHGIRRVSFVDRSNVRSTHAGFIRVEYLQFSKWKIGALGLLSFNGNQSYTRDNRYNYSASEIVLRGGYAEPQNLLAGGGLELKYVGSDKWSIAFRYSHFNNRFKYGAVPFSETDGRNGAHFVDFSATSIAFSDMVYFDEAGQAYASDENGIPVIPNGVQPVGNFLRYKFIGSDQPAGISGDAWNTLSPEYGQLNSEDFIFSKAFSELNETVERDPVNADVNLEYEINKKSKILWGGVLLMRNGSRAISLHEWFQNAAIFQDPIHLGGVSTNQDYNGGFLTELGAPFQDDMYGFLNRDEIQNFVIHHAEKMYQKPMTVAHSEYSLFQGSSYSYTDRFVRSYMVFQNSIGKKWNLDLGLRYDNSAIQMTADSVLYGAENLYLARIYELPGGVFELVDQENDTYAGVYPLVQDNVVAYPIVEKQQQSRFGVLLPSIHAKWNISKRSLMRMVLARTYRRPTYEELKPGAPVIDYDRLEYTLGNPQLKPASSWGLDVAYEKYMAHGQLLSGGLFFKRVSDLIFKTISFNVDPSYGIRTKSFKNAGSPTYLAGAEMTLRKDLGFLHHKLHEFGVELNATYVYSEFQVPGKNFRQKLPNQADLLANLQLFWDAHDSGVFALISFNYTSGYLVEVNTAAVDDQSGVIELLHADTQDYDQFMKSRWEANFFAEWNVNQKLALFGTCNNVFNSPHYLYRGDEERVIQVSYDSISARLGLKWKIQ